jgi:hypothetical protein
VSGLIEKHPALRLQGWRKTQIEEWKEPVYMWFVLYFLTEEFPADDRADWHVWNSYVVSSLLSHFHAQAYGISSLMKDWRNVPGTGEVLPFLDKV